MGRLHNHRHLRAYRRDLRQHGTSAEAVLWTYLRRRQLGGAKFRRQHSIGPYIVDFYCPEARLVVELDGAVHDDPLRAAYDAERQAFLERQGRRVIRFENQMVFEQPDAVLQGIELYLGRRD